MNEKALEQKLRKAVQGAGGLCLKFSSPYYTGMPDRIVLMPAGKVFFVEVKSPGKKLTERQEAVHKQLRARWFNVFVLDSEESLAECLRKTGFISRRRKA